MKRFEYLVQKLVLQFDDELIWCLQNMVTTIGRVMPPQLQKVKSYAELIGDVKMEEEYRPNE